MATIKSSEVKNLFTKALVDIYQERPKTSGLLRSFFKVKEVLTRYVSVEVIRGTELVAIDVLRGTQGNYNTFSKSTERIYEPPFYREYFNISALQGYDTVFGSEIVSDRSFAILIDEVRTKLNTIVDMIERAYELQCAQVLETGIVTMANGDNINFGRKGGSLVDNSSTTWATGTNNPLTHLASGAKFLRETGKCQGANVVAIMGASAFAALLNNESFQKQKDIKDISTGMLREPQRNAVGGSYHGRQSIGSYTCDIWTYPESYENTSGTNVPYINDKKVVMVPENPNFTLAFAGVPAIVNGMASTLKGQYHFGKFEDERNANIDYDVQSAGLAIPTAVDQIYTMQVLA